MTLARRTAAVSLFFLPAVLPLVLFLVTSCSSLSSWITGQADNTTNNDPARNPASTPTADASGDNTSIGENEVYRAAAENATPSQSPVGPNLPAGEFASLTKQSNEAAGKGYRRKADPWQGTEPYNEGSLWNPDTQESYYFSRNLVYKIGDFINIQIEPDLAESLNTKLGLMYNKPLKPTVRNVVAEEAGKAVGDKVQEAVTKAVGNQAVGAAVGEAAKDRTIASIAEKSRYFTTRTMTVRVTEVSTRGILKVEGAKKLFLRAGSFDLKLSGLIREEDIGPGYQLASSRVLDAKVEIVK